MKKTAPATQIVSTGGVAIGTRRFDTRITNNEPRTRHSATESRSRHPFNRTLRSMRRNMRTIADVGPPAPDLGIEHHHLLVPKNQGINTHDHGPSARIG